MENINVPDLTPGQTVTVNLDGDSEFPEGYKGEAIFIGFQTDRSWDLLLQFPLETFGWSLEEIGYEGDKMVQQQKPDPNGRYCWFRPEDIVSIVSKDIPNTKCCGVCKRNADVGQDCWWCGTAVR